MSRALQQSKELHGLGSSSGRGTKRTAEQSIYDDASRQESTWKGKEPVRIQTESMRRPPKPPNNVSNPFSGRMTSNDRFSGAWNGSNPTARMVVTADGRSEKRPKYTLSSPQVLEREYPAKYGSGPKYWPGNQEEQKDYSTRQRRAVSSFVPPSSSASRPTPGWSRSELNYQSGRSKRATPLDLEAKKGSTSIISIIDESEPEDVGMAVSRALPLAESKSIDEIDLINEPTEPPEQPSLTDYSRTSERNGKPSSSRRRDSLVANTRVPLPASVFPLRQTGDNRLAKDGESTKRLNGKLREQLQQATSSPADVPEILSSPLSSPPPSTGNAVPKDVEVEEIEDADGFIYTPGVSLSKNDSTARLAKNSAHRAPSPSTSAIPQGRVRQMTNGFEELSKPEPPKFIPDLRKAGRVNAMKGKHPSATSSNRSKAMGGNNSVPARDKHATARTPFKNKDFALPLKLCIWGKWKTDEVDNSSIEPKYWFYWNESASELQIHPHPPSGLRNKRPVRSIKFSLLRRSTIFISAISDFHLIRVDFGDEPIPELSDDVQNIGLAFVIISQHSNIPYSWEPLQSRLKTLMSETGKKLEVLRASSAPACLEAARNALDLYTKPRRREERTDSRNAVEAEPSKTKTMDEVDVPAQKKQPRPKPAHGKNQDIARMFERRLTRRSSRLSADATQQTEATRQEPEGPLPNQDEIILVYPPSGQGAVNITNGDLRRLEPSEFLNDTLIELGLKFWLHDLREKQPELAESIHVFSSFFFKKLAAKSNKTPEDGHKSVRKWTAKVDIFKKKFIIVPINENIHWYLAIIYQPEHILEPPLPKPPPRTSKRVSNAAASKHAMELRKTVEVEDDDHKDNDARPHADEDTGDAVVNTPVTGGNDSEAEAEVEELVDNSELGVEKSFDQCSLEESQSNPFREEFLANSKERLQDGHSVSVPDSHRMDVTHSTDLSRAKGRRENTGDVVEDSLNGSDEEEIDQLDEDDLPTRHEAGSTTSMPSQSTMPEPSSHYSDRGSLMDVDDTALLYPSADEPVNAVDEKRQVSHDVTREEDDSLHEEQEDQDRIAPAVPAASFYAASDSTIKTYENRKRPLDTPLSNQDRQESEADELDMLGRREPERESSEEIEVTESPRTVIFCMDSLGNSHPRALGRLNEYLQEEAKDKKGISNPSSALMKKALVPAQPNYCDCGLYLLHFAQTFVSDPEKYKASIFASKKTSVGDRNALWRNEEVGTMREKMRERIITESATWKKLKAEKEQKELENKSATVGDPTNQPMQVEQSDDEIEVSEVRRIEPSPKKPAKKASAPSAPAARLR